MLMDFEPQDPIPGVISSIKTSSVWQALLRQAGEHYARTVRRRHVVQRHSATNSKTPHVWTLKERKDWSRSKQGILAFRHGIEAEAAMARLYASTPGVRCVLWGLGIVDGDIDLVVFGENGVALGIDVKSTVRAAQTALGLDVKNVTRGRLEAVGITKVLVRMYNRTYDAKQSEDEQRWLQSRLAKLPPSDLGDPVILIETVISCLRQQCASIQTALADIPTTNLGDKYARLARYTDALRHNVLLLRAAEELTKPTHLAA